VNPSSTGPVAGARGAPRTGGYVHSVALPFPVRFAIVNAGAELVGLGGVGALSAWAALSIGPDAPAFAPVVIALGALEGAVVGAAQARLVREKVPSLRTRAWVGATIVGAVPAVIVARATR